MTDAEEAELVETLARGVHRHSSRRNVMQYLDNDEDCDGIARSLLPIIEAKLTAAVAEERERCAAIAEGFMEPHDEGLLVGYIRGGHFTAKKIATAIRDPKETPNG